MSHLTKNLIGKNALMLVLSDQEPATSLALLCGQVGAMEAHKMVAAIETAAKNNGIHL